MWEELLNMRRLSENQKAETITWLKKQRDGIIVGEYRNILYDVYQSIKNISINTGHVCTLQNLANYGSTHYGSESQLLEFCDMLQELGYIDIYNRSEGVVLTILKPIDF